MISSHQFSAAEVRQKRDAEDATKETSTPNILDSIKTGIEETFSEQNIKKAVNNINDFGDKLKVLGNKVYDNLQNALKKDDIPAGASA